MAVLRDLRANSRDLKGGVLGLMLAESVLLALALGVVVSTLTSQLVRPPLSSPRCRSRTDARLSRDASLGAGLYEELLFRVLLVGTLAWAGRRLLGWRPLVAGAWAAVLGALLFSSFHYIGPYGDPLQLYSFVFRAIAGLIFSALFLARGFGITAWTHALYDAFLLLR
jgi:hypothetical protein